MRAPVERDQMSGYIALGCVLVLFAIVCVMWASA